jgi:hypothetical protein
MTSPQLRASATQRNHLYEFILTFTPRALCFRSIAPSRRPLLNPTGARRRYFLDEHAAQTSTRQLEWTAGQLKFATQLSATLPPRFNMRTI